MANEANQLASKLENYVLQLRQVEAALEVDPTHVELLKIKADLNELIDLTRKILSEKIDEGASCSKRAKLSADSATTSASATRDETGSSNLLDSDDAAAGASETDQTIPGTSAKQLSDSNKEEDIETDQKGDNVSASVEPKPSTSNSESSEIVVQVKPESSKYDNLTDDQIERIPVNELINNFYEIRTSKLEKRKINYLRNKRNFLLKGGKRLRSSKNSASQKKRQQWLYNKRMMQ